VAKDLQFGGFIQNLVKTIKNPFPGIKDFYLIQVGHLSEAKEIFSNRSIDIILLDLGQHNSNGEIVVKKTYSLAPAIPIIALMDKMDNTLTASILQAGALDFLEKIQINAHSISKSIHYAIEREKIAQALKSSEEQFRQSQRMESVGRLAGGIAHDFNNLLTVITGYSDFLLSDFKKDDPNRSNVEEIQKAGMRAASLTRQLLAFSRKQVLKSEILDVNSVVLDVEKMLKRLVRENIRFTTKLASKIGKIKSDPGQLEQILANLVVNASDAMPNGGELTIETANVNLDTKNIAQQVGVKPGSYVMLAISDNGCGMDKETQGRIFEPFFTTKEPGKGTGLGLATVYAIVKQSGGNICVNSDPGLWTTFKIYLPRISGKAEKNDGARLPKKLCRGTETILLVEDDEIVRTLVRHTLNRFGYKVLVAETEEEAHLICRHHEGPIHLILTDIVMPKKSGPELVLDLTPVRPRVKALYMSGYTAQKIFRDNILDPELNFIQKPFAPDVLASKIREALDGSHSKGTVSRKGDRD
jgi:signal transduction histidine kinase/ActR/RegA family two-component response regulator